MSKNKKTKNEELENDLESETTEETSEDTLEETNESELSEESTNNESVNEEVTDEENLSCEDKVSNVKKKCEGALNEFRNKNLMLLAEMENARKRFEVEKQEFQKYRIIDFVSKLIPQFELFESALKSTNVPETVKNWLKGFEMIFNNIEQILESEKLVKIVPQPGDKFDHKFHEAIDEISTGEVEPGAIVKTIKHGFVLHDRLVTSAKVAVAKSASDNDSDSKETVEN